jgi:hypothetical protein
MIRSKSERLASVRDLYIFYTCLTIVLAIATFGIVSDVLAGR